MFAKHFSIPLFLRIDDLDASRVKEEFLDDIFFVLEWIGIEPDEGPGSIKDFRDNYSQINRISRYDTYLKSLENNELLFSCSCSRKNIKDRSGSEKYDGLCAKKNLPVQIGYSQRFRTDSKKEYNWAKEIPYPILRKKDGQPSYHLASCVDDIDYSVDLVIRGKDLETASDFHKDLIKELEPDMEEIEFVHHGLLLDQKEEKISKSNLSASWNKTRSEKKRILKNLGSLIGLEKSNFDELEQFSEVFYPEKIKSPLQKIIY